MEFLCDCGKQYKRKCDLTRHLNQHKEHKQGVNKNNDNAEIKSSKIDNVVISTLPTTINNDNIKIYDLRIPPPEDVYTSFKKIVETLNLTENEKIASNCFMEINKICQLFPPKKNENKFCYGKIAELAIENMFSKLNLSCLDLDKQHEIGSEYKNDIKLCNINVSVKLAKNLGDVILINKLFTDNHIIDINLLQCCIKTRKLYFIPYHLVDNKYIKKNSGCILYKKALYKDFANLHPELIYTFLTLDDKQQNIIDNLQPISYLQDLYDKYVKL
jgi:hypothetical protein